MEHGRWNAERLLEGWKLGPNRDHDKKISPYLVAWEELPEKIKQYDRDAVKALPEKLREYGYEIIPRSDQDQIKIRRTELSHKKGKSR